MPSKKLRRAIVVARVKGPKTENNRCKREEIATVKSLKAEKRVCCTDSYVLCYACICGSKHIFGLCIILACISVKTRLYFVSL